MSELEKDIKMAIEMIKNPSKEYNEMSDYSLIYQNTTENMKDYMPYLNGDYKTVLLPTASGDHVLEAILYGITDFTCFDINRLAKYFNDLKFSAFKSLTEEEFTYFMYKDFMNKEYYNYFKEVLNDNSKAFWNELYKNCSITDIKYNLFRFLGEEEVKKDFPVSEFSLENYTTYFKNYKLVQSRLQSAKIEYIDANLLDLPNILDKKYDLINLTNIYEYINRDIFRGGASLFGEIVEKLLSFINENGKMLITYLYGCNYKEMKKFKKKSIFYAYWLCLLEQSPLAHSIFDRDFMEELYAFRNSQLMHYMKKIDVEEIEIDGTLFGNKYGDKDMVLVYKKSA